MKIAVIALSVALVLSFLGWYRRFVDTWTLVVYINEKNIVPTQEDLDRCRKKVLRRLPTYLFRR